MSLLKCVRKLWIRVRPRNGYGEDWSLNVREEWNNRLIAAAKRNQLHTVKRLLDAKADVTAKDEYYGRTALHWAAQNGHKEVVALLLDRNPDLSRRDGRIWMDGVALGGVERAQGRGRAAVGQDGGRRRRRDGRMMDGRRYIGRRWEGTRTWSRCCWTGWRAPTSPRRTNDGSTALHSGGERRAQGRGRAAVGQDGGRRRRREGRMMDGRRYIWRQGRAQGRGRAAVGRDGGRRRRREGRRWMDGVTFGGEEGHKDVVALLLDRMEGADVAATDKGGSTALHRAAA